MDQIPKLPDLLDANSFTRCPFDDSQFAFCEFPTAFPSPVFYSQFGPERIDEDPVPAPKPSLPKNADLWFECEPAPEDMPAQTLRKGSFASADDSRWVSNFNVP